MKKLILLIILLLNVGLVKAQKVFSVDYEN